MNRYFFVAVAIAVVLGLGAMPVTANLVFNADFEINGGNGTPAANWTPIVNSYGAYNGFPHTGGWMLHAGAGFGAGGVFQDLATQPGHEYLLRFYAVGFSSGAAVQRGLVQLGTPGSNPNDLALDNVGELVTAPFDVPKYTGPADWQLTTHTFTATGAVTRLTFENVSLGPSQSAVNIDTVEVLGRTIENGDFEVNGGNGTNPPGWVTITNSYGAFDGGGVMVPADGVAFLHPGNSHGAGGRYQDVATTPGQAYRLSFQAVGFFSGAATQQGLVQVGTPGSNPSDLALNNNAELVDTTFDVPLYAAPTDWTPLSYTFTPTTDITRISFQNVYLGPGASAVNIDAVTLELVPEPSTLILLLLGCVAAGFFARKRS